MVPETMVAAIRELGWLALLVTADDALATEPDRFLSLLDGLIVLEWAPGTDQYADSRGLSESARARGLPVLRLPASLVIPETTAADYTRAIGGLFTPDARVAAG